MNTNRTILLLFLLLFIGQTQASTDGISFINGNELVNTANAFQRVRENRHNSSKDFGYAMEFMGYVTGISETLFSNKHICKTSNTTVTVDQLTSIVLKYLKENPDVWHYPGIALVEYPLRKAFPCNN